MQEIERKFLVKGDFSLHSTHSEEVKQGYISTDVERTVRIRTKGDKGYITIKGKSNAAGTTRLEWEKEIAVDEATELLKLCQSKIIEKRRHYVPVAGHTYEVDVFQGRHEGLILAEIELSDEHESFEKPEWLGEEVTGKAEYYNSYLATN